MKFKTMLIVGGVVLTSSSAWSAATAESPQLVELVRAKNFTMGTTANFDRAQYPLTTPEGRNKLKADIQTLLLVGKNQAEDAPNRMGGDLKKGLKFALQVLEQMETATPEQMESLSWQLFSVTEAINNNYRPNLRTKAHLYEIPGLIKSSRESILGNSPLKAPAAGEAPWAAPESSTIWKDPQDIAAKDLRIGFNRKKLPDYSHTLFTYLEPKTGYGTHAGFRVTNEDGDEFKIRIGAETSVGPFSSRIVWALGYNTIQIDHLPVLKLKYDRRLLTEYNLRTPARLKLKAGTLDLYTFSNQQYRDPFQDIAAVTLSDGTRLTGAELKKHLLKSLDAKAELTDSLYDEAFEKQIQTLEFHKVSIEKISKKRHSVGPWDWSLKEHTQIPVLRAYGFLAGWLGQYDARTENTRVTLVETGKNSFQLEHTISDVGSGLGEAAGLRHFSPHNPEAFTYHFIERVKSWNGSSKIQSVNYRTIVPNKTFEAMNEEDAKWMLHLIAQLTPQQIRDALEVSGFTPKEVDLLLRKLMVRRNHAMALLK